MKTLSLLVILSLIFSVFICFGLLNTGSHTSHFDNSDLSYHIDFFESNYFVLLVKIYIILNLTFLFLEFISLNKFKIFYVKRLVELNHHSYFYRFRSWFAMFYNSPPFFSF